MPENRKTRLAILLPTYNEAENIEKMLFKINEVAADFENKPQVVVIDDQSPDSTGRIAKKTANKLNNFEFILLSKKKEGLGKAYKAGMEYVFQNNSITHAVQMDADFSHPVNSLIDFEKQAASGKLFIVGSRYSKGGRTENWSIFRKFLSVCANRLIKLILSKNAAVNKLHLQDITGGFNCYQTQFLKEILGNVIANDYTFQIELKFFASQRLLFLKKPDLFGQFPIVFSERAAGVSKIPASTVLKTLTKSFELRRSLKKHQKPCCK